MSIELNNIVRIDPHVLPVGQSVNTLFALMLSKNPIIPNGTVEAFTSAEQIGKLLGYDTLEYKQAVVYFKGFTGSANLPATLYMAYYPTGNTSAFLEGGDLSGMELDELRTISGDLSISIDGTAHSIANLDLTHVDSFSEAAQVIEQGLGAGHVTFSSGTNGLTVTSPTSGNGSSVGYATGEVASFLRLTAIEGAIASPAASSPTPAETLNAIRHKNQTWATFFCAFDPADDKMALAQWVDGTDRSVMGILHDTASNIVTSASGQSWAEKVNAAGLNGVFPVYHDPLHAAFVASIPASLDFTAANGRYNFAFRRQTGLAASVTDLPTALTLEAKGYNFYGDYASETQEFNFLYPGSITGEWLWADSYINQIWMGRQFRAALVNLLLKKGNIPYNITGSALLENALTPAINQAVSFGAIQSGISLSEDQQQAISNAYGKTAVTTVQSRGWFLSVRAEDTKPEVRVKRGSPPMVFYYFDGQSVNRISFPVYEIQ